jgi:hypothetical protein
MDHPARDSLGAHTFIVVARSNPRTEPGGRFAFDQSLVRIPPVLNPARPFEQLIVSIFSILTGASAVPGG